LQPARILRIKKAHLEKLIFSKEIQIEIFQKAGLKIQKLLEDTTQGKNLLIL
jgi:hypothetical protein